jgi:hypothetical protein
VRLGTWLPFEQVPAGLAHFTGVATSRETARRLTEAVGAALVAAETAAVEALEWSGLPPPMVPTILHQGSVDGVMVPLVHKEWTEAKTLAIGRVVETVTPGRHPGAARHGAIVLLSAHGRRHLPPAGLGGDAPTGDHAGPAHLWGG